MSTEYTHINIEDLNREFHSTNLKRLMERSKGTLALLGFTCDMTTLLIFPPVDTEDLLQVKELVYRLWERASRQLTDTDRPLTFWDFKQIIGVMEDIRREQPDAVILNEFLNRRYNSTHKAKKRTTLARPKLKSVCPIPLWPILEGTEDTEEHIAPIAAQINVKLKTANPIPKGFRANIEAKRAAKRARTPPKSALVESLEKEIANVDAEFDAQDREHEDMLRARKARC